MYTFIKIFNYVTIEIEFFFKMSQVWTLGILHIYTHHKMLQCSKSSLRQPLVKSQLSQISGNKQNLLSSFKITRVRCQTNSAMLKTDGHTGVSL